MFIKFNYSNKDIKYCQKQSGFTLIEMAISLIIVGILMASVLYGYTTYITNKQSTKTLESISTVTTALFQYKNANGRYPCPAPILESKDTSNTYGHETNCADLTIGTPAVVPPGSCIIGAVPPNNFNGICVESSPRTILGVNPRVRMGGIPFRELQLDEKDTIDGYGSRLVYAVTENMAVSTTYKDTNAAIEIRDNAGTILSGGDQSVAFVVLSPGKNKNGAVSTAGVPSPCLTGGPNFDGENCRDFTSTANTQAIYTMDAQASGTNQFDDIVEYYVPTAVDVWRRQSDTSEDIVDMSEDKVGVGITSAADLTGELTIKQSTVNNVALPASTTADTNISGSLAATNAITAQSQSGGLRVGKYTGGTHTGKILANQYCAEDGLHCFTPNRIAGNYDGNPTTGTSGMGCPAGQYMTGIQNGRAKCSSIRIACNGGQAMTGTNADGSPICTTPVASCPSQPVSLCSSGFNLNPSGNGVTQTINYTTNGACAKTAYTCTNGTWIRNAGLSSDAPARCTYSSALPPTGSTGGKACTTGYTGTYTQNWILNCSGTQVTTTSTSSTDCQCVGITTDVVCPGGGFGSSKIGTKKRVCTGNVLGSSYSVFQDLATPVPHTYPTEAALVAAKCSCGLSNTWEFGSCGSGKVRAAIPSPITFTDPIASWPANASLGTFRKRTVSQTCAYDNTAYDSTNCVCATGTQFRDQNPTCGSCYKIDTVGKVRQIRSASASCGWIDDPDDTGNTLGNCKPKTFIWKSTGVSAGPSNALNAGHGLTPTCDSACTCGQSSTQSACAISTSSQWTYFTSTCTPQ